MLALGAAQSSGADPIEDLCRYNSTEASIFIFAGQSNAMGIAKISDTVNPSAWFWNFWQAYGYPFQVMNIPFQYQISPPLYSGGDFEWHAGHQFYDMNRSDGLFGPDLPVTALLQQSGRHSFYIFKAAVGSSSLGNTGPNSWLSRGEGGHYDRMISALRQAAQSLCDRGLRPRVQGFFWTQGESDSGFTQAQYRDNLRRLVDQLDEEAMGPNVPVVIAKLRYNPDFYIDHSNPVRLAQDEVNGYRGQVVVVPTDDLSGWPAVTCDTIFCGIHYDTNGILNLGYRYFEAWKNLRAKTYRPTSVYSNSEAWSADHAIDGQPNTIYSSLGSTIEENVHHVFLAAWLPASASGHEVNAIQLKAWMYEGRSFGFPITYALYLTNEANSMWDYVGTYDLQPSLDGTVTIVLPESHRTHGVAIQPIRLGTDLFNNYYLQLDEIALQLK